MQEEEGIKTESPAKTAGQKVIEEKKNFICGVIEGFYGRPWTTEQRKDLFRKLKKWGMDSYVYAPKDDYKHRAYWRELYTVEEADHLSSLIAAAKEHGVTFYYALSPGLDMTYSSQKEIQTLKRKLDQVSQFGCEAFALLFDDIESELSKADKEVFQTFANAQVSVTNEVYSHLGNPTFLFCPTQYCSSRAVPTVHDSEYLNTLGSKLNRDIEIMWTGNKVISKIIALDAIQELTEVLRRPPVIWDNLHANDYDQKRVFLGPYSGRSPELIPHLRGVMTNPNCEFHANTIAIHTLANWSKCSLDSKVNRSLSADIKLETENDDGTCIEMLPADGCISKNVYHPLIALKNAISEWLPEFFIEKEAWGPITKPQPQVTMVMPIIPIIPSINTCMSLTTTTTTSTNSKTATVPEVNTTQLQALAEVCTTVNSSAMNPIANPVMNSLVSPTKVITNDNIMNPITTSVISNMELPKKIPISIVPVPIMHVEAAADELINRGDTAVCLSNTNEETSEASNDLKEESKSAGTLNENSDDVIKTSPIEDIVIGEKSVEPVVNVALSINTDNMLDENNGSSENALNEPMECGSSLASQTSPKEEVERKAISEDVVMSDELNNSMQVESSEPSPLSNAEMKEEVEEVGEKNNAIDNIDESKMTVEDLHLLCDLFYLPFEHGSRGYKLLNEFNWLKVNANVLLSRGVDETKSKTSTHETLTPTPDVAEWLQRAEAFSTLTNDVQNLLKKVSNCANKEICYDLFSYVWDIAGALTLLNAFIKWLCLGHFPQNVYTFIQGSYTWFSKGWKEAYMSGEQEPWVFRGGLTADLQRLIPVDSGNDLFLYKLPETPTTDCHVLRPYAPVDEVEVNQMCIRAFLTIQLGLTEQEASTLPDNLCSVICDTLVGPFITFNPEFCIVAHDNSNTMVGYIAAAMDIQVFLRNIEICWIPAMCDKYAKTLTENSGESLTNCAKLNDVLHVMINEFHNYKQQVPVPEVITLYPAVMSAAVLGNTNAREQVTKRLLTVTLAALRANGCFGVHVRLSDKNVDQAQYYAKLGFAEIYRDTGMGHVYFGRRF